ncbi:MAG: hypothetical protein KKB51_11985 [Candidatus Riflebacteria bacterium]|nr:hypothetical protein [Candidatus Riflebacteria bacterium]
MKCFILAIICALLPQLLLADDLRELLTNQKSAEFAANYREISAWSGCLILPEKDQRESDGSVWIQLDSSPDKELCGKILRLCWDFSKPENGWFKDLTVDVAIDEEAAAKSEGKFKSLLPRRLNGWKSVSPLESIAGAHMVDDIEVMLINPVRQGNSLVISDMPIQIAGDEYGLVRFVGAEESGLRLVEHFDSATRSFQSGKREVVRMCMPDFPADSIPVTSTDKIESATSNGQGWYVYGKRIDGVFHVETLEPRALLRIRPATVISGSAEVKRFIDRQNFAALTPDLSRVYHLNSGKTAISPQQAAPLWKVGEKGIVCHLFGWRRAYDDILGTRKPSAIEKIVNALLSKDSMFPRSANDGLLNAARKLEAPMYAIMFSQIGGNIPGLVPMAPTSIAKR